MKSILLTLFLTQSIPFYPIDDVSEFSAESVDVSQYGVLITTKVGNQLHVGSGVLIKEGVLTAQHCCEGQEIQCESNGEVAIGRTIKQDAKADLAVIRVHWLRPKPIATLSISSLTDNEALRSVGRSTDVTQMTIVQHTFNKIQTTDRLQGEVVVSPAFNHGRSGGGLFTSKGEVVGIVVSATPSNELKTKLGYAASLTDINKFLGK